MLSLLPAHACLAALAALAPPTPNVLIVQWGGAPGTFATIQGACDASAGGDTVLVKAGTYSGFAIVDKSITIAAEAGALVHVNGAIRVRNLTPGETVVLSGLWCVGQYTTLANDVYGLVSTNNGGQLRAVGCHFYGASGSLAHGQRNGFDGARFVDTADAALTDCAVGGGASLYGDSIVGPFPGRGGAGLSAIGSVVTLYHCDLAGGQGLDGISTVDPDGGNGGDAYDGTASTLFASRAMFSGGYGGSGTTVGCFISIGGNGGSGLVLVGGLARLVSTQAFGGWGGSSNGTFCSMDPPGLGGAPRTASAGGTFIDLPVAGRSASLSPNPVRENATLSLALYGLPGDRVSMLLSTTTVSTFNPQWNGQQLLPFGANARLIRIGTLPGTGTSTYSLPMTDLGPGVGSRTWFLQTLSRGVGGEFVLGSGAPLIVLDAAY